MFKTRKLLGIFPGAALLAACGSPELPLDSVSHFPQTWDQETLWKNAGKQSKSGLFNFHYDSSLGQFLATQKGSFAYSERSISQDILPVREFDTFGNDGNFSWKSKPEEALVSGLTHHLLHYRDVPVDSVHIKKLTSSDGSLWMNGQIPEFMLNNENGMLAEAFSLSAQEARNKSALFLQEQGILWSEPTAIYYAGPQKLTPAWKFVLSAKLGGSFPTVPTEILLSATTGEILKTRPLAVHFEGSAEMFEENPVASSAKSTVFLPLISDGQSYLKSAYWQIKNCNRESPVESGCAPTLAASSSTFTAFPYDSAKNLNTSHPSFTKYDELVAYHAMAKAFNWNVATMNSAGLSSSQYSSSWGANRGTLGLSSNKMLTVYTRSKAKSASGADTYDNAQYLPGGLSGTGSPAIVIGTGTEEATCLHNLCNIGKDADVTMHEFHHHIIFRSLTSTSGETGAMHEGLADYLTYAITGNNKLAESIVHRDNSKKALRAGNLRGTISQYISQPIHVAGEFWSSVLWDVRSALGQSSDGKYKADKIIWDAIDLSVSAETYYGFVSAMAKAADAYAEANNDSAIELRKAMFSVFAERGFLASTSLDGTLPGPGNGISQSGGSALASSTIVTKKTSRSGGICGVVAHNSKNGNTVSILFLAIGLLFPLAFTSRSMATAMAKRLGCRRPSQFQ
jgi:hypothetical protein